MHQLISAGTQPCICYAILPSAARVSAYCLSARDSPTPASQVARPGSLVYLHLAIFFFFKLQPYEDTHRCEAVSKAHPRHVTGSTSHHSSVTPSPLSSQARRVGPGPDYFCSLLLAQASLFTSQIPQFKLSLLILSPPSVFW